ncbi:MAG: glutathione-dependent reductase [Rhodospirillum sp.]|nr:glutathione-dependent reductase [Rhodospirillum sp.]
MGLLVEGKWQSDAGKWADSKGRMQRPDSILRNWITPDGSPGPTGRGGFKAEAGRYHLYIARACPWAHRAAIFRELKGLQDMIGLSVTHWLMLENGWTFDPAPGVVPDTVNDARYLYELYAKSEPGYSGRVTVPVLWDKKTSRIVSNESADIIRMLNNAFDGIGATPGDYYPEALRAEIDAVNKRVYDTLNNGVYKAGFAGSQEAYDEAVVPVFETLDWLEEKLSRAEYLVGNRLTEADWRLFTTLLRFDPVYHTHFKCNLKRLVDYPALWRYTRRLYQHPAVRPTMNFDHIKGHYFQSHRWINPTGIVPKGPIVDFDVPVDWTA